MSHDAYLLYRDTRNLVYIMNPDGTIAWIKESLTNDTPLRAMYLSKKSDMFVMWAEALERKIITNTLDEQISGISNYIRRELISMKLDSAVHHMYHTLPAKFKRQHIYSDDDEISHSPLLKSTKNSSGDEINYTKENATLVKLTKKIRDSLDTLDDLLETSEIEINCEQKYLDEVIKMADAVSEKAKFCTDGREKISRLDHVLALELSATCTLNSIYATLTAQKMQQSTITSKQMGKIVSLKIKDAYTTLRPTTEQQAISQGWSGITCEECAELRVVRDYLPDVHSFMDHCVTCDHWQKMQLSPVLENRSQ